MRNRSLPSVARLDELFNYDHDTGQLTFKISQGAKRAGTAAGCVGRNGYLLVRVDGNLYRAHRLIWSMYHGFDPGLSVIDHANGDRQDNSIRNLRLADQHLNGLNARTSKANTSGRKGVHWDKARQRWLVTFCGNFVCRTDSYDEAASTYAELAKSVGGEFAKP
ncbi:HNH endonuclease [Stenotrophomonas maltophilia]|nr:HNH endonuclease [Stenotrophomonas maltophilia]